MRLSKSEQLAPLSRS